MQQSRLSPSDSKHASRVAFVVSSPRSGSTWLLTALNAHPEIFCTENRLFGNFAEMWPNNDGSRSLRITLDHYALVLSGHFSHQALGMTREQSAEALTKTLADALINYASAASGKPLVVDKITPYLGTADRVLMSVEKFFPSAPAIQLLRDGRDVAVSGVFDWLLRSTTGEQRRAYFVEKRPGAVMDRFFDDEDLHTWIRYWTEPIRAFAAHRPDAYTLRYETMQQDQAAVLREVFSHLGVDSSAEFAARCIEASSFERMSGGRARGEADPAAKARKGVAGDWRNYFTRRDGELFHSLAGGLLLDLGYETDARWHESLPEKLGLKRPAMA